MASSARRITAAAFLLVALCGCRYAGGYRRGPGTMQHQQYSATLHDPYTDNDAGPPVVGGRPRDFEKPLAEPVRNRWLRDIWWAR